MQNKILRTCWYFLVFTLIVHQPISSNATTVIKEGVKFYVLTESPYFIYEDKGGKATIEYILANPAQFEVSDKVLPENDQRESVYWIKFPIVDSSGNHSRWLIELYNYRIDSIDAYFVYKGKILKERKGGDHLQFKEKEIPHKNFAYSLPLIKHDTVYCLFKVKSNLKVDFYTVVKRTDYFIGYSNGEYYLLGMLYGILSIVVLYNLFYLLVLRDSLYFYYLCFTIGYIIYFMSKDGTGFQYLWNNYPTVNDKIPSIAICFSIVNQLLFTFAYFRNNYFPTHYRNILWIIVSARIVYTLVETFLAEDLEYVMMIDIPVIVFMLWIGLKNIDIHEVGTYYFPGGLISFLLGFLITALFELNLISHEGSFIVVIIVVYASTIGVVAQIIAFWGSLSFHHRKIVLEKKKAEYEIWIKHMEINYLQRHKEELEKSVTNAVESIQKKNEIIRRMNMNLETFIYKSSHNLRSPLSTSMGLYQLSKNEDDPKKLKELFEYMNKSIQEMDRELTVVSKASTINHHEIVLEDLNLFDIVQNEFTGQVIHTKEYNRKDFQTRGDRWLLSEGIKYLSLIHSKMDTSESKQPSLELSIDHGAFVFTLAFECSTLKQSHAKNFFTPYHKDIGYLYELYSEPYLCQVLMDKIRGTISMKLEDCHQVVITIKSRV